MKFVYESLGDILKPKGAKDVIELIKDLPVNKKIEHIKKMQSSWGKMYQDLIKDEEIKEHIREEVKEELDKLDVLEKVNYIEKLEKSLPDIFYGMRDDNLLNDLKDYIIRQEFEDKARLLWRFFKSWPDLFQHVEEDPRLDDESNQLMLLFRIKRAINNNEIDELQSLIQQMGERYGRKNILDKASSVKIPESRYGESNLFNKKDIEQLKLSLYKETRSEEEILKDEYYNIYAFIGYPDFIELDDGMHKKTLGIENLVKIDKYDSSSLSQVPMMKIRAQAQGDQTKVWAVYIPKHMWDEDYAYNKDIPDDLREFIDENKFKI